MSDESHCGNMAVVVIDAPDAVRFTARRVRLWVTIFIAVALFVAGVAASAVVVLAFDRDRRAPLGNWVSEFVKSSGFAGACALAAASLAFWGILTQVSIARKGLDYQRLVDDRRAWWEYFEWAASRAVPESRDGVGLPYAAIVSTLTALTIGATSDVQRSAIGSVMDVASDNDRKVRSDSSATAEHHAFDARILQALTNYVRVAADTPARSAVAEAQLYELQVIDALARVLTPGAVDTQVLLKENASSRLVGPDAVVQHLGKRIIIEVKRYRNQQLPERVADQVLSLIDDIGADAALIVSPTQLSISPRFRSHGIVSVVWRGREDDKVLRGALDEATT